MPLTTALLVSLALGAGADTAAGGERLLLCRPALAGDPALARPEAVREAGRQLGRGALDYGVPCESAAEAARAAGRAGLERAVWSVADGASDGSRYTLVLTSAGELELGRRGLLVATGDDPVPPLAEALRGLKRVGEAARPGWARPASWSLLAGGTASLAAGVVLGVQARDQAHQADAATTPRAWLEADQAWRRRRTWSAVALGVGGAALAGAAAIWLVF
jgi:hypothetical protein